MNKLQAQWDNGEYIHWPVYPYYVGRWHHGVGKPFFVAIAGFDNKEHAEKFVKFNPQYVIEESDSY